MRCSEQPLELGAVGERRLAAEPGRRVGAGRARPCERLGVGSLLEERDDEAGGEGIPGPRPVEKNGDGSG